MKVWPVPPGFSQAPSRVNRAVLENDWDVDPSQGRPESPPGSEGHAARNEGSGETWDSDNWLSNSDEWDANATCANCGKPARTHHVISGDCDVDVEFAARTSPVFLAVEDWDGAKLKPGHPCDGPWPQPNTPEDKP